MNIIRAIIISSLTIPALIFVLFLVAGVVFMVSTLLQGGEYNKGWLGMVYAGSAYGYLAILISSIPTIVLGLPASILAQKYNLLNRQVIMIGSFMLGGMFMAIAGALIFNSYGIQVFVWLFVAGGVGGLMNGAVLFKQMKANNSSNQAGAKDPPSS